MKKLLFGIAVALLAFLIAEMGLRTGSRIDLQLRLEKGGRYQVWLSGERKINYTLLGDSQNKESSSRIQYEVRVDTNQIGPGNLPSAGIGHMSASGGMVGTPYFQLKQAWPDTSACRKILIESLVQLISEVMPAQITPWATSKTDYSLKGSLALIAEPLEPADSLMNRLVDVFIRGPWGHGKDKTMENTFDRFLNLFSKKPVRIGDTWSAKMEMTGACPAVLEDSLKLTDRKAGVATLELRSMMKPDPAASPIDTAGLELRLSFSGDQRGTLLLDEKTGLLNEGHLEQHFTGEIVLTGLAEYPDGITIPLQIEQKVKIEVGVNPLEDRDSKLSARDSSGAGKMLPEKPSRSGK
ncbi:MAG: hypothetical protein A3F83_12505 [Candidatus Glassbacteria bacterium RIFCSPLOWO2_12_FULL_58_11]|uniref:Uncharacterized protein n=1 Tax=Candidatus Glassbacteria bacterium RIFCSPLOWO2_12_FULL_58_11 TaxID=1817867 RepID=A0A1F5YMC1_9BACT|nr:MAG: hypothetical protein A3F83_12505 [Candidatus Glassbacteria bacterium RIFCSPLOWO2_12_FULL_58_11]